VELRGKTVLVIGLKRTGVSVARFVAGQGGHVRVTDRQSAEALASELAALAETPLDLRLGTDTLDVLDGIDLVVPSPGVPACSPLLAAARRREIAVWSEIELAARFLSCPLIAVTGTNGKSTTTTLIGDMLGRTVSASLSAAIWARRSSRR
jgi:UDP-N-acetylmuramoylalanine-D-glutamate ligase